MGNQAAATPRTNVVDMGRYLAQNGISVEQVCLSRFPFLANLSLHVFSQRLDFM